MQHSLSNTNLQKLNIADINNTDNDLFKVIMLNYNQIVKEIEHNKMKYNYALIKISKLEKLINILFLHLSYLIFILSGFIFASIIFIFYI